MTRWLWLAILMAWLLPAPAWAQCGVFKTWAEHEVLTTTHLNSGFNRTVTANTPTCADDYSSTTTQMRATTDPYPSSAESLATTLAGELERLRYQMNAIAGKTYWYQTIDNSLAKDVAKHWGATFTKYTEIADPTTPATNQELVLYAKDDGAGVTVLAYKDSVGSVTTLTGASSSFGNSITLDLKIIRNAATPTTQLDVTASHLSIEGYTTTSFSKTINAAATGANALDTGALANTTLYYVWAIFNPSSATPAALLSTSETAPTMPSGYTKKRVLGAFRTDGSAQFLDGIQRHDTFLYAVPLTVLSAGGSVTAASVTLSGYVPATTAREALLVAELLAGANNCLVVSPFSFAGSVTCATAVNLGPSFVGTPVVNAAMGSVWLPLLNATPTVFYYGYSSGTVDITIAGWRIAWK